MKKGSLNEQMEMETNKNIVLIYIFSSTKGFYVSMSSRVGSHLLDVISNRAPMNGHQWNRERTN